MSERQRKSGKREIWSEQNEKKGMDLQQSKTKPQKITLLAPISLLSPLCQLHFSPFLHFI